MLLLIRGQSFTYSKLNTRVSLMLPAFSQKYPHLRLFQLKFRYSEKAKKKLLKISHFVRHYLIIPKKFGDFFKLFWPFVTRRIVIYLNFTCIVIYLCSLHVFQTIPPTSFINSGTFTTPPCVFPLPRLFLF